MVEVKVDELMTTFELGPTWLMAMKRLPLNFN